MSGRAIWLLTAYVLVGIPAVRAQDGQFFDAEKVVLPGATHATSVGASAGHLVSFLGSHPRR